MSEPTDDQLNAWDASDSLEVQKLNMEQLQQWVTALESEAASLRAQLAASEAALAEAREELAEDTALREKLADLLTRTANALKGPPAKLSLHSWHDLPKVAAAALAREAALRALYTQALDCAEFGWTVIANASGGNWSKESPDWVQAAEKFRDDYYKCLDAKKGLKAQEAKPE